MADLAENPLFCGIVHTPPHEWMRPRNVKLERAKKGQLGAYYERLGAYESRLLFTVTRPMMTRFRQAAIPKEKIVKAAHDTFGRFLKLSTQPEIVIEKFAEEFGPLGVYSKIEDTVESDIIAVTESVELWRYWSRALGALRQLGDYFRDTPDAHQVHSSVVNSWTTLANCPIEIEALGRTNPRNKARIADPLSLTMHTAEVAWAYQVWFVGRSLEGNAHERDRHTWLQLINTLIELGRVRPWLLWEQSKPRLVFSGPGLLSYLALQLCHLVSRRDNFACDHCAAQYYSERAPKRGQLHFCPACRDKGVGNMLAMRRHREQISKRAK